jgi:quercetin dioxygenase-like cupin family protein
MHEQVKIIVLVLLLNSGLLAPAAMRAEPATDVSRQLVGAEALPNVPGHKLTAVTIELGPGISVPSHVHDGFVFVYVLEGSIRSQLDDAEAIDYRSGDSWVEPPGTIHALTQNPSKTDIAKILAIFVAREGAQLTTSGVIFE